MADPWQVVVVGGGPAGAAVAIGLARRGVSVAVLEAAAGPRDKPGECLPPGASPLLAGLGLSEALSGHSPTHGNRSVWGGPLAVERHFLAGPLGHGWTLDRRRFEGELAQAAMRAGVGWRYSHRLAGLKRCGRGWELAVRSPAGEGVVRAEFVVDATGRAATVASRLGARRERHDPLVGAAAALVAGTGETPDSFTLVEAAPSGWWYSARRPGGTLAIMFMTDADLLLKGGAHTREGWARLVGQTRETLRRVRRGGFRLAAGPSVAPAGTAKLDVCVGEGWLAVGDAAASFDPLSSYGITSALGTGAAAAEAVTDALAGRGEGLRDYVALIETAARACEGPRRQLYSAERRWPLEPFWQRRHG